MAGLEGQRINDSSHMALVSLAKDINHLVGVTATKITKPANSAYTMLVMFPESGNFRAQLGDTTGTISAATPSTSLTNGTGSWLIPEGQIFAFTAPANITVIGDGSGAVLTYYWL